VPRLDPATAAALRGALDRAGYNGQRLEEVLGSKRYAQLTERRAIILGHRVEDDALGTLVRLFLLAFPVGEPELAEALAPFASEELESCGLLARDGESLRSCVRLTPFEDLLVASDHDPRGRVAHDYVPGLNNAAQTMAALLIRRRCRDALDVGTGCGVQALIAARYSDRVVATDVNPRALEYGQLGAALNGFENIDWREGSLFDPVRGERFDSLVCNAPFVVSPDVELAFRDSDLPRDSFCEQLVRESSQHLAENGIAQLLISWALSAGDEWSDPLRHWTEESACDAWLLGYDVADLVRHTDMWTREVPPDELSPVFSRWLTYLTREQITSIGYGAVYLRRREGSNWTRADELPAGPLRPATEHVLRVLATQDVLARDGDQSLSQRPVRLAEDAVLREWRRPGPDGWLAVRTALYLTSGLRFRLELEPDVADFVGTLDGAKAVEIDPNFRPAIRRLAELGFLELEGSGKI
jgi:SAM-dependent methyltransferase